MGMYKNKRKGFTFIELIFVIVVLGIVASIISGVIAQLYDNYLTQRAMQRVSSRTELAINQIINRLTYRISSSVIARNPTDNSYILLENAPPGTTNQINTVLEWIGYDNDSFSAANTPGWSGYCDTNATASPTIVTPGSTLTFTDTVISNLSGGGNPQKALLFSLYGQLDDPASGTISNASCYGYDGNTSCIHIVNTNSDTKLITNRAAGTNISSQYKLAWTAYAVVPTNLADGTAMTNTLFDLELRYNYQPWNGIQYNSANAQSKVLIRNVTAFKFTQYGGTLRVKLCATEDTGRNVNISVCKEKVVIR